jgi:hypothetical protein
VSSTLSTANMTLRRPSAFGGAIAGSIGNQLRVAKLRQLELSVPIRRPHHDDIDLDAFDAIAAVHPGPLDRRLAFDRHAELGEEGDRRPADPRQRR